MPTTSLCSSSTIRFALAKASAPLLVRRFVRIDLFLLEKLARHEIRIAAEQNVGAAAGHVGGDRDRAFASGLGHDLGFALVILGVQNIVRHAFALQTARDQFGVFN